MGRLTKLFFSFNRIGAFTFGGGYAMLPLMTKELTDKHHWISECELMDYFAVSQCLPGMIAVNVAVFVGSRVRGMVGAAAAVLGVVAPSFFIIWAVAALLNRFMDLPAVVHAFNGVRAAVAVLMVNTVTDLLRHNVKSVGAALLFIISAIYMVALPYSPVYLIAAAVVWSLIVYARKGSGGR